MKMTKRMLLVAFVLVGLLAFSFGVSAADITVSVTISNQGAIAQGTDTAKTLMAAVPVKVPATDGEATIDAVLTKVHADYCPNGYATDAYGVSKLWNETTANCLFTVNGQGIATGVTVDKVKDGDYLVASVNKDNTYYADWTAAFSANQKAVALGQDFTLTVKGHFGMAYTEEDKADVALAGLKIGTVSADGSFKQIESKVTDKDGKVTLCFKEAGTYVISAQGTVKDDVTDWNTMTTISADCPIIAPVCIVTVGTPVTAVVNANAQCGNEFLVAPLTLKVAADTAESYGYADAVSPLENVSALDVLVALHQYKYSDFSAAKANDYFAMTESGWITKAWKDAKGSLCYTVNGKNGVNAATGYGYMVNEAPVENGDTVEFFQSLDTVNYADECAWFMDGNDKLNQIRVKAGEAVELTVKSYTFMWYAAEKDPASHQQAVSGLKLAIWQDGKIVDLTDKDGKALTTDNDGKVKVTFADKGTYTVIAYNTDAAEYFSLPVVNVSVYNTVSYDNLKDLKAGTWYESYVKAVLAQGYMVGTSATAFSPNDNLTRGMFAEILYRVAGCPNVAAENPFTDVAAKNYYYNAVKWAYETGISNGMTATSFAPQTNITREQMATMLDRYLTVIGAELTSEAKVSAFADDAEISSYAKDSVYRLAKIGLLQGKGNQLFDPKGNATRAEIATVIARLIAE